MKSEFHRERGKKWQNLKKLPIFSQSMGKQQNSFIETLENTGLFVCLDGHYGPDPYSFIVMRKCTPDETKI